MNQKGQNTLEIIIISIILLGLLLTIALIMVQRNADTERIATIQRDTIKCHHLSSIITSFNSNQAYSQRSLIGLEENVLVAKGSIVIGEISCRYAGNASEQKGPGNASEQTPAESFNPDDTGFTLERERDYGSGPVGVIYKVKKIGGGVIFCDQTNTANDWC